MQVDIRNHILEEVSDGPTRKVAYAGLSEITISFNRCESKYYKEELRAIFDILDKMAKKDPIQP